jgi:uncharacterized protein YndB with AHSA1/START domain
MMSASGFIVMADITGFTGYLNESELDHAQQSIVAVLDVIVESTDAPLTLSRVVGDAVVSYALDGQILNPQTLVEELETIYVVFRRAVGQMVLNTTCSCNACANLSSLDLKFIVHHGEFALREIAENEELIGPNVNLVFRLAKNTIRETLGFAAYIAYTSDAAEALDFPEFVATLDSLEADTAEFGSIGMHVADMHPVWEKRRLEAAVAIPDGEVMLSFVRDINAPVGIVWDHVTNPAKRSRLFASDSAGTSMRDDGKMGVDGTYVCAHGKMRIPHRIVDWIPLQQYTFLSEGPMFRNTWQFHLTDLGDATRLQVTVGKTRFVPRITGLASPIWRRFVRKTTINGLREFIESVETSLTLVEPGSHE